MTLQTLIFGALDYAKAHPLVAIVVVVVAMRLLSSSRPFPHDDSWQVTAITTLEEWHAMIAAAKAKREIVVCDFYATWCPPCKAAAPQYGEMSKVRCAFSSLSSLIFLQRVHLRVAARPILVAYTLRHRFASLPRRPTRERAWYSPK